MKPKNFETRTLIIVLFGLASVLALLVSLYMQSTSASDTTPRNIQVDFSVFPENDTIALSKGEVLQIPLKVESPANAEYTLSVSVLPSASEITESLDGPITNSGPSGITAALDNQSIELSSQDSELLDIGNGRVIRDSGIVLIITSTSGATEGNYSFIIDARRELSNGEGIGAGKVITVSVR